MLQILQTSLNTLATSINALLASVGTDYSHPHAADVKLIHDGVTRFRQLIAVQLNDEQNQPQPVYLSIAAINHDLRNALTSILGFSELLLRLESKFEPGQIKNLQTVFATACALLSLVNDTWYFRRLQEGRIDPRCHTFDLLQIGEITARCAPAAPNLPLAYGDSLLTQHMFNNVISYITDKLADEPVVVSISWSETFIHLTIHTDLRLADTQTLFAPMGDLRLPVARGLAEAQDGRLTIDTPDSGAVFQLDIPILSEEEAVQI
jgi:signal transduction histidine kinase